MSEGSQVRVPLDDVDVRYPFVDSMSKSTISAVSAQHAWPGMLATLNWMVDINMVTSFMFILISVGQRETFVGRDHTRGV